MKLKSTPKNILIKGNMKYSKKNILIYKILMKCIIDNMIPLSEDKLLPKASDAINMNKFLSQIPNSTNFKKKLDKIILNLNKKNLNNFELGKVIMKSKQIESDIGEILIQLYFSSKLVQKQLIRKLSKKLPSRRSKNKDYSLLLKLVKNSSSRHKHF